MRMYLCIDGGKIPDRKARQFWVSNIPRVTVVGGHLDVITGYYLND
jgi:hypothetical protein